MQLKQWLYIVMIITISVGLGGCSELISKEKSDIKLNSKEISNIRVECYDHCKEMGNPPFLDKTFEDSDEIEIFVKAINAAQKIDGVLDYGIKFLMHISFKDGSQKTHVLNIDDEKARKGLFVETVGGSLGYTIPEGNHDELSKLIYH